jgi:branched-chain amino acid transport system permease protein
LAAAAALRQATRWRPAELGFWFVALASWFLLPDWHLLLNEIAIYGLFALSLDLILGYAGIISLGHAAFFGFGAYLAGLLAKAGFGEPIFCLLAAGAACAVLGFATSFLVLRGTDLTRLMVTLSVAAVLYELANRFQSLTGGADGLQGIAMLPVFGRFEFDIFGHVAYGYSLGVLFVLFLVARRVVFSPFGWSVRAVKGNALRTAALGIPVTSRLIGVYTLAAAYAGISGALLAETTQFVSLDVFSLPRSADPLLMVLIGGTGYLYGGLVGAVAFKVMQNWLSDLTPEYWQFWLGCFLVLLVLCGRERLFTTPQSLLRLVRR